MPKGSKNRFKTVARVEPNIWKTSKGSFKTKRQAALNLKFPEYSNSKTFQLEPDIVEVEGQLPTYDLILGTPTLAALGIKLDFETQMITIDSTALPMRDIATLQNPTELLSMYMRTLEPISTEQQTSRAVKILDAKYEKANLPKVVSENCAHLTVDERNKLLRLLLKYEELFDGGLGEWQTDPISLELKEGATPYHGKPFRVPQVHESTTRKEVERLVHLGVLKRQSDSEWGFPTFIIPKKNGTVRFISDFRELNKRLKRKPFPLPKIAEVLQQLEGFQYATALDLNMGYYTIRLDPDAQKICTIVLPWGKYSYLRLPMGVAGSPDIFQEKMSGLMESLEFVRTYLGNLLILTKTNFEDHLTKLDTVLERLRKAGLRINAEKSTFCTDTIEYLGYILTRDGIKPQKDKIQAILALKAPTCVKELRRFLGLVQYYRDLWEQRSHVLAPLTDLVGECGQTKATKKAKTKKKPWHWDKEHQQAFDSAKELICREVLLAYPDYSKPFDIYTDASTRQLGAVITQNNRPIAFFSRKLSDTQRKYTVTELELLSIIETLKEFKGMLWGHTIRVYTDHKNLIQDASGMSSDRVFRWRMLLEEYGPEIIYIKGIHNTVADAISRLDMDPTVQEVFYTQVEGSSLRNKRKIKHSKHQAMATLLCYMSYVDSVEQVAKEYQVFATHSSTSDDSIYPVTIPEIADAQRLHTDLSRYFTTTPRNAKYKLKILSGTKVVVRGDHQMVVPPTLQSRVVQWYHFYLQHPGHTRLEETIKATMYWKNMRGHIRKHVKICPTCQRAKITRTKYGKLPTKVAVTRCWQYVCVDCIGPYTIEGADGTVIDFMCVTMIDPASAWFEIIELPVTEYISVTKDGKPVTKDIFDTTSAQISRLVNKAWFSRYPRPEFVIYDNGSEFKLNFQALCKEYGIFKKPTTVKNPTANAILERMHAVIGNMLRTRELDMAPTVTEQDVEDFLVDVAWAIRSTHHTVLGSSPGAAIFGRDMLFDIPYTADWNKIGLRRQQQVNRDAERINASRKEYDYAVGQRCMLKIDGVSRKAKDKYEGPYLITQVYSNGNVRIQRGSVSERLNIRRIKPYFEVE